ncbi:MAG: YbjN domain-containing protein [Rhodospirillales bacterium]|nr:YbjN domain-containing protein [Rhodospirillales bacterium]
MKRVVQSAAAVLALFAAANAQEEPISNPRGMVANFDPANLTPLLAELGVAYEVKQAPNGQTYIAANAAGVEFAIVPAACVGPNGTGCVGAHTYAMYSDAAVNMQTVNAFNQRFVFSSAGVFSDNSGVYVGRYDIADYGIARGNVQSSIASFRSIAAAASAELSGGGQTISTIGYAEDISASLLNEASARATGVETGHASGANLHLKEIRAMPEFVKAFAASGSAAFNKIENVGKQ